MYGAANVSYTDRAHAFYPHFVDVAPYADEGSTPYSCGPRLAAVRYSAMKPPRFELLAHGPLPVTGAGHPLRCDRLV